MVQVEVAYPLKCKNRQSITQMSVEEHAKVRRLLESLCCLLFLGFPLLHLWFTIDCCVKWCDLHTHFNKMEVCNCHY